MHSKVSLAQVWVYKALQTALTSIKCAWQFKRNAQYQQNMGINALQNQYGLQQQAQMQKDLDTRVSVIYLNASKLPIQANRASCLTLLRGVPLTSDWFVCISQLPPSTAQNIASLGLGAAGISKLWRVVPMVAWLCLTVAVSAHLL
jgi:hypothetical protein